MIFNVLNYKAEQQHCSLQVLTMMGKKKKLKYALMSSPGASLSARAEHTKSGDERWIKRLQGLPLNMLPQQLLYSFNLPCKALKIRT